MTWIFAFRNDNFNAFFPWFVPAMSTGILASSGTKVALWNSCRQLICRTRCCSSGHDGCLRLQKLRQPCCSILEVVHVDWRVLLIGQFPYTTHAPGTEFLDFTPVVISSRFSYRHHIARYAYHTVEGIRWTYQISSEAHLLGRPEFMNNDPYQNVVGWGHTMRNHKDDGEGKKLARGDLHCTASSVRSLPPALTTTYLCTRCAYYETGTKLW